MVRFARRALLSIERLTRLSRQRSELGTCTDHLRTVRDRLQKAVRLRARADHR